MELDQCIKERRTIRAYTHNPLPDHVLSEILDAARYAPSSGNVQNWRFVIVKDKKNKEILSKACGKENAWVSTAPVLVVVCSETDDVKRLYGARGEALYAIQNCAAAIQNILLKAHSLGVASGWTGDFDEHDVRALLGLELTIRPQAILTLGYGKNNAETPHHEPIENLVFFERYGKREAPPGHKGSLPLAQSLENELEKIKHKLHGMLKK